MQPKRWSLNPFTLLKKQYQISLKQVEQDLTQEAISLPAPAAWTKRLTLIILVGLTAGAAWSVLVRIDVVIDAQGKLEPLSQSQAVQSKVGGVVTSVLVRDGQQIKQGQLLMQLDKTPLLNQLQALLLQRDQMIKETAVLRMARQGASVGTVRQQVTLSPELTNRVQTRRLLIAQLSGDSSDLAPTQQRQYDLFQQQLRDRLAVNQLEGSNLETQISGMNAQLSKTDFQFKVEQELLSNLKPLMEEGAIPRTIFLQRVVDVNTLQNQLQQDQLQKRQLQLNHLQSQAKGRQAVTELYQDLQQQLAALDAEFDNTIEKNQRELIQLNAQLNQIQLDLKSQDLRASVDGIIFNLGPKLPGVVAEPGQILLQIVPNESLIARVQVANADIANLRVGMPVDVRIDAYPFTEFGSVSGVVAKVGREALKVDGASFGQTVFPVEIRLNQQFLERRNQRFNLVPGMSLVANIKVRERAPISYVSEELIKALDAMRSVR
ncbi:MAG TPA: HlyD family efflux transporter periplasmic adaptor subunit [Trichocoleus sp.]|jgi:HlyD family secretion protein